MRIVQERNEESYVPVEIYSCRRRHSVLTVQILLAGMFLLVQLFAFRYKISLWGGGGNLADSDIMRDERRLKEGSCWPRKAR